MAEVLESYEFGRSGSKYDWESLLDGQIHRLTNPDDFTTLPSSLVSSAKKAAERQGKTLNYKVEGDNAVVIQAVANSA